jgi:hypothetical protein
MPKYVVASTLETPKWSSATVLQGRMADEVSGLKHEVDGEIAHADRARPRRRAALIVYPFILGEDGRLFDQTGDKKPTRLLEAWTLGDNLAYLA